MNLRLLQVITGISAFLLFQIELIIAKMFLPHYGGSYLVWGACVVFFQAVLLLGYVFAHFVIQRYGLRRYRFVHLALILLPLLFFPGRPLALGAAQHSIPLVMDVFLRLCTTVGPVFFVLSTVSITSQMWLSASALSRKFSPYALYAVSNLGSFAALLSYPFVFETYWDLSRQIQFWRFLYFLGAAFNLLALRSIEVKEKESHPQERREQNVPFLQAVYWLFLGAGGVIMFLSATNIMTSEIAPVPLLWIIPLSLYLLSFVLNFQEKPWCPSWIVKKINFLLGCAAFLFFLIAQRIFPVAVALILLCGMQFVLCMYCQNRLAAHKPKTAQHLTVFYVIFSFGGFIGGLLTTWIIPLISSSFVEYWAGLVLIAVTLILEEKKIRLRGIHLLWVVFLVCMVLLWPILFPQYNMWGILMIFMILRLVYFKLNRSPLAVVISLLSMVIIVYHPPSQWFRERTVYTHRNYYGITEVFDLEGIRRLCHGGTLHGAQYLDKNKRGETFVYYSPQSPIGEIFLSDAFSFERIGVIGLGTGTLSAFAKAHQAMDFYELDPDIYTVAGKYFTYTHDSAGRLNFIFGDARRSLENGQELKYDLLVVDAFGGDTIPFHLLTQEAVALYRRHLTPQGILLFHISNRYVNLKKILGRVGLSAQARVAGKASVQRSVFDVLSTWLAMTWDEDSFQVLRSRFQWAEPDPKIMEGTRLWTDQYINILPAIQSNGLLDSIKNFKPFNW